MKAAWIWAGVLLIATSMTAQDEEQSLGDLARQTRQQHRQSTLQTVTSTTMQSTLQYPTGWKLKDSDNLTTITCTDGSYKGQCSISVFQGFLPSDQDEFSEQDREQLLKRASMGNHVLSSRDMKIGKATAFVIDTESTLERNGFPTVKFREVNYNVISPETRRSFWFQFVAGDEMQEHVADLTPQVEAMIASVTPTKTYTREEADALYGKGSATLVSSPRRLAEQKAFLDWMHTRKDPEMTAFGVIFAQSIADGICAGFSQRLAHEQQGNCMKELGDFKTPVTDTRTHQQLYPLQDPNYSYVMHVVAGNREYEAIPKTPGNGGWLLTIETAYYNPNGKAAKQADMQVPGYKHSL